MLLRVKLAKSKVFCIVFIPLMCSQCGLCGLCGLNNNNANVTSIGPWKYFLHTVKYVLRIKD